MTARELVGKLAYVYPTPWHTGRSEVMRDNVYDAEGLLVCEAVSSGMAEFIAAMRNEMEKP